MKRILLALAAVAALALVGVWLSRVFASHSTRIVRLLAGMEAAFDEGSARGLGAGLADDFVDEGSGSDRRQVMLALMALAQAERTRDGEFRYRARVVDLRDAAFRDRIEIDESADPPRARLRLEVEFSERVDAAGAGAETRRVGSVAIEAAFVIEGGDWKVHRARVTGRNGRLPF